MRYILILIASLLFLDMNSQWLHTGGPYAIHPKAIASNSTTTYAMIDYIGCLNKSSDGGQTWTVVTCAPPNILALAVIGNTVISASPLFAVSVSPDNGVTWTYSNLLPSTGNTVTARCLLALQNKLFLGASDGVYCSSDIGYNWSKCSAATPSAVTSMVTTGDTLFVGTEASGIFCSIDNGLTWATKNLGLSNLAVIAIASEGNSLAAATNGGLYYSANGGNLWTLLSSGMPPNIVILATEIYLGKVYVTTNAGVFIHDLTSFWQPLDNGLTIPRVNFFHKSGSNLLAATEGGGFCRYDGISAKWLSSSTGLSSYCGVIDMAKSNNALFAASFSSGIYIDSVGQSWKYRNTGLYNPNVQSLSTVGNTLWVGGNSELFYSINNGMNWTLSKQGIPNTPINAVTSTGSVLLAAGCATQSSIYRSTNNGISWNTINTAHATQCIFDFASTGNTVYAATQGSGVLFSIDQGLTWGQLNTGLPSNLAINVIKVANGNLYAGTSDGLYRYGVAQQVWTALTTGSNVNAIAITGTSLYVGTGYFSYSGDLLFSPDDGITWVTKNEGLNFPFAIRSLFLDGGFLYAGLWFHGVWKRPLSEIVVSSNNIIEEKETIEIFPVPVEGILKLQTNASHHELEIVLYDFLGNVIKTEISQKTENTFNLDVSELTSGLYFMIVRNKNELIATRRFIKN